MTFIGRGALIGAALVGWVGAGQVGAAQAQDFPTHPLTIVVPFTSGGTTEIMARLIGKGLEEKLGKPVVVENKPGAGTVIGSNYVAKSEPDGYTMLMATSTPMAINVTVHKALPYNPATDLVPLAMVALSPFVLVVNNDLPVKSVKELIAYAKANPGKLTFGSGGPGAPHHLFAELFDSMAGIKMTHVPYKGSLPALNDVLAGHIQLMFVDVPPVAGMIAAGKVRALGVTPKKRLAALPNIPTIDEAGVPGYDAAAWFMVAGPAKTPKPIVERLHKALKEVLAAPAMREQIKKFSLVPMDTPSVADMQTFVKSEIDRWGKVVRAAGIAGTQ
jgi:tripartite-type tricarboxylate transporter receptor subunit TctC